ncbi:hypothetical protein L1049_022146 [Liquidambar formosana]|uniref:Uncharacterized protein n=1 Tax=Liquidambar formosana TaxID=63359 RepID=A0AAP0RDD1_LIQFO
MAKILAGRRRYMGHKRTIRPNAKKLSSLFMARNQMDWESFAKKVKSCQKGFMGEPDEMRLGRAEFHEFPASCICQKPFKYYDGENSNYRGQPSFKYYDGENSNYRGQPLEQVPIVSEEKFKSGCSGKKQGEKSIQRLNKESMGEGPVSLVDSEDDEFFPD